MRLIHGLSFLLAVSAGVTIASAKDVSCVLNHSAVAELNESFELDVHTTDNDGIEVRLEDVGEDEVTFNGEYKLTLIKREEDALFYSQPALSGLIIWIWFPRANAITYAKLRAFPITGLPSSYLMIAKCQDSGQSVEYYCRATKKFSFEKQYTSAELEKWQFATRVEEIGGKAWLSRCSYSIIAGGKITCDRYEVDRIDYDSKAAIKKYYVFRSQFDFQIFSDLRSLENNGRGDVQYGKCEAIAP